MPHRRGSEGFDQLRKDLAIADASWLVWRVIVGQINAALDSPILWAHRLPAELNPWPILSSPRLTEATPIFEFLYFTGCPRRRPDVPESGTFQGAFDLRQRRRGPVLCVAVHHLRAGSGGRPHDHLQCFHNHLVLQAGAYQNGIWVVGVAKVGREEGCDLIGPSCIIAPTGEIVAMCSTLRDELATFACDFDRSREIRDNIFNFLPISC